MTQHTHDRLAFDTHAPAAVKAINALHAAVASQVDAELLNIIFLRASQVNGCAYCTDSHSVDLARLTSDVRRVYSISSWHESTLYTPRERAALRLTESVTRMSDGFDPAALDEAREHFTEAEVTNVVMTIITINAWNGMGVTSAKSPPALA